MSRASLKPVPPALSPEREALAAALADAAPVRAALDEARAKAEAARGAMAAASEAVPAAERAVEDAKAGLVTNPAGDRGELRRLRAAVTDAIDDLEIARGVAERLEADLVDAERACRYGGERVEAAANAVIAPSFDAALAKAQEAGRQAAMAAWVAEAIAEAHDPWSGAQNRALGEAGALSPHISYGGHDIAVREAARSAAKAPWVAARAALISDASAPLPEV